MTRQRRPRGPRSLFGPKALPNRSHSMTALDKQILATASRRNGCSESDVVCALARLARWRVVDAVLADAK